jgi:hypothetical protein
VAAAPAINCPTGGTQITDGYGIVTYVCDGATGAIGPSGPTGPAGPAGPAGTVGQNSTTSFGTNPTPATMTVAGGNSFIPGIAQMVTVPANAVVLVQSTGGVQTSAATVGGFSVIELGIYIDNALQGGTRRRVTAVNATTVERGFAYWSISQTFVLTAGSHTFNVAAFQPVLVSSMVDVNTAATITWRAQP